MHLLLKLQKKKKGETSLSNAIMTFPENKPSLQTSVYIAIV